METALLLAWWICPEDRKLGHGDQRPVGIGETFSITGAIVPGENGLHASIEPLDALSHSPSSIVCRVEVSGDIVYHEAGDKLAAHHRKVIAMADCGSVLRLFASWCAAQALVDERINGREPDQRSWNAVEVVRRYAGGEATAAELDAARAAAWVATKDAMKATEITAAPDAAHTVAWNAAWNSALAAAKSAARAADRDAATVVAWNAAWDAANALAWNGAWNVVWEAARATAWEVAWTTVRDAQNNELERLLLAALGLEE
jgi:hypothetical protein